MEFPKGELCDPLCLVEVSLRSSDQSHIENIENQTYFNHTNAWKQNDVIRKYNEKQVDENMNCKKKKKTRYSLARRASLDSLLHQIYRMTPIRRCSSIYETTESSEYSPIPDVFHETRQHGRSYQKEMRLKLLSLKNKAELRLVHADLTSLLATLSSVLLKELKKRDRLLSLRHRSCDVVTAILCAHSPKTSQDTRMKFTVEPFAGDSGFSQWHDAMKMCARLPGGIPQEFRRRMWLTLSEQHVRRRNISWKEVEKICFNEWASEDDEGLGDQIVKDLHRTGCSLFCGKDADVNQALLKRVLLGFARWNKSVGYCQGFNMLAAIILKVMDCQESDALKVMLYLIEGVLPESYFANNLRGLSVDMAVFRDLMRTHLPNLSLHLESLQQEAADKSTGACYEPPLTNVFTMQWFLTLFSNCLPEDAVMRVWDLTFLQGNEVLLRTALAIWGRLSSRILQVQTADEFYTVMGNLTREMLTHGLMDGNQLVQTIVGMAPFPFPGLNGLREKYTYNITPWTQSVSSVARKGLRIFYLEDEDLEEDRIEDHQQMAVAAAFGLSGLFRKSSDTRNSGHQLRAATSPGDVMGSIRPNLDISSLKKQYEKLRERQKQAHVILTASHLKPKELCRRHSECPKSTPLAMKHLLRGKKALTSRTKRVVRDGMIPSFIPKKKVERKSSDTTGIKINKHEELRKTISSKSDQCPVGDGSRSSTPQGSTETISPANSDTLLWKDEPKRGRRPSLPYGVKLMQHSSSSSLPDIEDDDGTNSSTSTELCDDDDLKMLADDLPSDREVVRALSTSPRLENVADDSAKEPNISLKDFVEQSKQTQILLDEKIEAILSKSSEYKKNLVIENPKENLTTEKEKEALLTPGGSDRKRLSSLSSPTKWKWSFSEVEDSEQLEPISPILTLHNFEDGLDEDLDTHEKNPQITVSDDKSKELSFINYDKSNMFSYLFEITDITKLSNNNSEEPSPIEETKNKYFNTEELELSITQDSNDVINRDTINFKNCDAVNNEKYKTVTKSENPDVERLPPSDLPLQDKACVDDIQDRLHRFFRHITINESPSKEELTIQREIVTDDLQSSEVINTQLENKNELVQEKKEHSYKTNPECTHDVLTSPQEIVTSNSNHDDISTLSCPLKASTMLVSSPTESPKNYEISKTIPAYLTEENNSLLTKKPVHCIIAKPIDDEELKEAHKTVGTSDTLDTEEIVEQSVQDLSLADTSYISDEERWAELLATNVIQRDINEDAIDHRTEHFSNMLKSLSLETNYSELGELWPDEGSPISKNEEEVTPEIIRRRLWAGVKFLSLDAGALETSRMVDNILETNFPSLPTLEESPVECYKPLPRNLEEFHKMPISPVRKHAARRKSEAALQLMEENTKIIDEFSARRGSDKENEDLAEKLVGCSLSDDETTHIARGDMETECDPHNRCYSELLDNRDLGSDSKISDKGIDSPTVVPFSLRGSLNPLKKRGKSFSGDYGTTCQTVVPRTRPTSDETNAKSNGKLPYNPFPKRPFNRPPKDSAVKLGLYAPRAKTSPSSPQ